MLAGFGIVQSVMVQAHERKIIFCAIRGVLVEVSYLAELFTQIAGHNKTEGATPCAFDEH
jgi:hypothetical protein